eukprot:332261-Pleurochrysis_carterae.AAC.1
MSASSRARQCMLELPPCIPPSHKRAGRTGIPALCARGLPPGGERAYSKVGALGWREPTS